MKKTIIIIGIFLIGFLAASSPKIIQEIKLKKIEISNQQTLTEILEDKNKETEDILPKSHYLDVPFICQAPLQTEDNWKLHEESCEEAAVLQTYLYETGKRLNKNEANQEILKMIDWEIKNLGDHNDLYAIELKKFITAYYNLQDSEVEIIFDANIEEIKKQIWKGHPVIVPITGDILNNPYYPYPGYHMLVAIGYSEDKIVTNDNGTRRGANFSYDIEKFEKAHKDAGGDIIILNLEENQ